MSTGKYALNGENTTMHPSSVIMLSSQSNYIFST